MKITDGIGKYAAEQGLSDEEAHAHGMIAKSEEVGNKGSELYAKADCIRTKVNWI
jgi:hypothetical protein